MKFRISIVFCFCMMWSSTFATAAHKGVKEKPIRVFLFAGQSNMDGRADGGKLSSKDIERLEEVADRIQFYYNHKPVSKLQLSEGSAYVKRHYSLEYYFGPELFFGIELAEAHPDERFISIKRSIGGTSLYGCWNPCWEEAKAAQMNELNQPKLFGDFISYTKEVLKEYKESDYELSGMLWVQGEADSNVKKKGPEPSETYAQNLQNLITETRKQLHSPELPFAMFQVGAGKVVTGMQETAEADDRVFLIPQSKNKNSVNFYPTNPPPIGHYVTESMKRIGQEFFRVYTPLLNW